MEQLKISQAKLRVSKVQEGWEKGFYTPEEVQTKLAKHREAIAKAESEIERLRDQMANRSLSAGEAELLRQELKALRDRNLRESTFEEKADLVAKLGIKILPSEDLKSRKIFCRLNLAKVNEEREQASFTKVTFGGPFKLKPRAWFRMLLCRVYPAMGSPDIVSRRASVAASSSPSSLPLPCSVCRADRHGGR